MAQVSNDQTEEQRHVGRSIGGRIAASRKAARLDQKELARRLGVKPPTMNRWETGYTPVSVYDLKRVAAALKMPVSWFLDDNPAEEAEVHSLHLQQSFRHLIPEYQSVLLTLLHELLRIQEGISASDAGTATGRSEDCRQPGLRDTAKEPLSAS